MKEQKFMENWEKALESYDTPRDFADNSYLINLENPYVSEDIPLTIIVAQGYSNRAELMKKQRENTNKRKAENLPPRWKNDGNECFLCDNIGQAEGRGDNLLLPFNEYTSTTLLPNRYAAMRGHILVVEKEHQKNGESDLILSPNFLATAIEISEKYNMCIMRNHPKSGMSIPKHDHFHSYPRLIKINSKEQPITQIINCNLIKTDYSKEIFRIDKTRFATLAFQGKKSLESILRAIRSFEKSEGIFTLFYYPKGKEDWQGIYFLTPHKIESKKGGAGYGMYFDISPSKDDYKYHKFLELANPQMYRKKEFNWEEILC